MASFAGGKFSPDWAVDECLWRAACRLTNSVTRGPDTDALRMSLIRPEANIVRLLTDLLERPGGHDLAHAQTPTLEELYIARLTIYLWLCCRVPGPGSSSARPC
jgi:hypothetical protein